MAYLYQYRCCTYVSPPLFKDEHIYELFIHRGESSQESSKKELDVSHTIPKLRMTIMNSQNQHPLLLPQQRGI